LAAPIVAAAYALAGRSGVAYPGSLPYGDRTGLHDVTSGANGACATPMCHAAAGYDGPTGLGSPARGRSFTAPLADVSLIAKAKPSTPIADAALTYTITVANAGPAAADGVAVAASLPPDVAVASVTPSAGTCSTTPAPRCTLGRLAAGASATVAIA